MTNYFGTLTPRMQNFRNKLVDSKKEVCVERAIITTKSYKENKNQPLEIKRALMLKDVLENMYIYIEDETLLVANQASKNLSAPIFPEYAMDWVIKELDEFEKRPGDIFYISEENKEKLREIAPFWENETIYDKGKFALPEETKVYSDLGIISYLGKVTSGDGHFAPNYERLLKEGLKRYKERIQEKLDNLDYTDYNNIYKGYFYKAGLIVIDASINFAQRYAKLALEMAEKENDEIRKNELLEIARISNKVPYEPAETFQEALQSIWFLQVILQIESNGHSLSYGRLDQYLNKYLEKDLKENKITEEQAIELLTNLWIKTYTINKIRPWGHTEFSAGSPLYQNVTVGGQNIDETDATNKTSWLILKSVAQTHLTQPNLTVRCHKNLSKEFMQECMEVIKCGFGMPAFNNDEIIIPSFIEKGVSKEDAYNYSAIGCVETAVPGKWGYRCTGMSYINFPKTLLIAMNKGIDPQTNTPLIKGIDKHFKDMNSYEDLLEAWEIAIREMTRQSIIIDATCDLVQEENTADVLGSLLTEDCIERGLNMKKGGSVYDFISGLQVGISNFSDSLAAIKKLIFDEKIITTSKLWDALMDNFESEENQKIRELLLNAPKYGNDIDYVDNLGIEAYNIFLDEMKKYKNNRYGRGPIGGIYYGGTSSITANVPQGASTLATPDGRKAKEPLAEGCSPTHGMDINGPTAVFKSVSKLPTKEITGGVLLNQKVNPTLLNQEGNQEKLIALIRTFFNRLYGYHVQYNVVSKETLLDAQIHPEKHKDLIVRVAGYSAFFNGLSKQTQDDIIDRTEQTI
ncbi:MAG: glycyl radical protein [Erysipelotrichaceae bacterium]|nr:glycyl radical protein [Erysipelotrichaceae bacterium]